MKMRDFQPCCRRLLAFMASYDNVAISLFLADAESEPAAAPVEHQREHAGRAGRCRFRCADWCHGEKPLA